MKSNRETDIDPGAVEHAIRRISQEEQTPSSPPPPLPFTSHHSRNPSNCSNPPYPSFPFHLPDSSFSLCPFPQPGTLTMGSALTEPNFSVAPFQEEHGFNCGSDSGDGLDQLELAAGEGLEISPYGSRDNLSFNGQG